MFSVFTHTGNEISNNKERNVTRSYEFTLQN